MRVSVERVLLVAAVQDLNESVQSLLLNVSLFVIYVNEDVIVEHPLCPTPQFLISCKPVTVIIEGENENPINIENS